jgi:hypothetical protein
MLRKIRALLDKAEASPFPAEAEALTAKALELMARYHVTEAVLAAARSASDPSEIVEVDIGLGRGAYVRARLQMIANLAPTLSCQCLSSSGPDGRTAHVIGHRSDVDQVQLLLVQATAAAAAQKVPSRSATVRFRRSFLYAYGNRAAERIADARKQAVDEAPATSVALALVDRDEQVRDWVRRQHPRLGTLKASTSPWSKAGVRAGRAAADRADLTGGRGRLRGERQAIGR